jgi:small-conductance mechanosensitive channel
VSDLSALLLLAATLAWAAPAYAQGTGGAPKPGANPLGALLNKTKVQTETPDLPAAIPEQPMAIPLPDVAARSLELGQKLRDAAAKLPTREQLDSVETSVAEMEPNLATKLDEVDALLAGSPNSLQVREEENFWRGMIAYSSGWQQQLLRWSKDAQATLATLDEQEPAWTATYEANKGNHELAPVLTLLQANLTELQKVRKQAQESLRASVNLQIKVGALDETANGVLARLTATHTKLKGHLLDRDSLPIWKAGMRRQVGEGASMFLSAHSRWISVFTFLSERAGALVFLALVMVVSMALARRAYHLTRNKQPTDELEADAYRILKHWLAVGLLLPMAIGYVVAPSAPVTVLGLVILVSFFPILIILPPLLNPRFRVVLYFFGVLYAISWLIAWFGLPPSIRRETEYLLRILLFAGLFYLTNPFQPNTDKGWRRVPVWGIRTLLLFVGTAIVADTFGYTKLAHYLSLAGIYGTILGICVFTAWRVLVLFLVVGLRSPSAEKLAVVRLHRNGITRWAPRILAWAGALIWCAGAFDLLGIKEPLYARLNALLDFHVAGQATGATLGGVLGFFLILAVGYAVASAVRFFFREEVFRHFHLSRGLPELIASIIYYLLMVFVVLMAVNAGGIELNKFTVLTGAFGVGIGFGLQNIINNFVSGLILQFERPIHIDDILEVDTNTGKVTRIGIRSSTIRTFQGAEVIIPNATLISSKVINWTLSESQRRRELPVGVAYGSDPGVVLKILIQAAARHELVLTKPEPMAYFKGFGESSLDFELHFWVMQENNGMQITSEVALAVMKSLTGAGIEIPFPQRDLHLRSIDPTTAGLLSPNEKK